MVDLVRLAGRVVWSAGAAALLGLAVAWLAVGMVVADAYGEQKGIDSDTRGTTDYDWATFTADPLVGSLFARVWAAAGTGLFLLFTLKLWDPVASTPKDRTRPPLPPADRSEASDAAPAGPRKASPKRRSA